MTYSWVWPGASRRYSEPSSNRSIARRRAVEVELDHGALVKAVRGTSASGFSGKPGPTMSDVVDGKRETPLVWLTWRWEQIMIESIDESELEADVRSSDNSAKTSNVALNFCAL